MNTRTLSDGLTIVPPFSLPAIPLMPVWDVYRNHPDVKVSTENERISSVAQYEEPSLAIHYSLADSPKAVKL